jgi:hypothetical protein
MYDKSANKGMEPMTSSAIRRVLQPGVSGGWLSPLMLIVGPNTFLAMHTRRILMLGGAALLLVGCSSQPKKTEAALLKPHNLEGSLEGYDLPSFYDRRNKAEAYGRCPKCRAWVTGYYISWDGADGGGSGWWGHCKRCDSSLVSDTGFLLREPRIVQWKVEHLRKAQQRSALDARTALCLHVEGHWPGASESER